MSVSLSKAEELISDARVRDWSYVLEGQQLRLLRQHVQSSIGEIGVHETRRNCDTIEIAMTLAFLVKAQRLLDELLKDELVKGEK